MDKDVSKSEQPQNTLLMDEDIDRILQSHEHLGVGEIERKSQMPWPVIWGINIKNWLAYLGEEPGDKMRRLLKSRTKVTT